MIQTYQTYQTIFLYIAYYFTFFTAIRFGWFGSYLPLSQDMTQYLITIRGRLDIAVDFDPNLVQTSLRGLDKQLRFGRFGAKSGRKWSEVAFWALEVWIRSGRGLDQTASLLPPVDYRPVAPAARARPDVNLVGQPHCGSGWESNPPPVAQRDRPTVLKMGCHAAPSSDIPGRRPPPI